MDEIAGIGQAGVGNFGIGSDSVSRSSNSHTTNITSSIRCLISVTALPSSHTGSITSGSSRIVTLDRDSTSYIGTINTSIETLISTSALPASHVGTVTSNSIREIDVSVGTSSYVGTITSSAIRLINRDVEVISDVHSITSTAIRSGVQYSRGTASYFRQIRSFASNERTSLELVDYDVTWDDSEASWYTPWTQEFKILGSEDTFVVRSQVVDAAKYPAALLEVQYDENGDGTPDEVSEPIFVGSDERVYEVPDIPVSEDGRYRLKISEYSGYNAIYSLNMGIVN